MNFLEPVEEFQNLLCEAEFFLEQQGIVLVPVNDFRLKVRQCNYKKLYKQEYRAFRSF